MICKNAELFLEEAKNRGIELKVEEVDERIQRVLFVQDLDYGLEMHNMIVFDTTNDFIVLTGTNFVSGVNMEKRYFIYGALAQLNGYTENFTYILRKNQIVLEADYIVGGAKNFDGKILFDLMKKMKTIANRDAMNLIKIAH